MAVTGIGTYGGGYGNLYTAAERETDRASGTKGGYEEYIGSLQKKEKFLKLHVGTGIPGQEYKKTGTLTINPKILDEMKNDPEKETFYLNWMKDIQRAEKLSESFSKSMGHTKVFSHWYIDENGKLWHTAMTVKKDDLNEKLREKAKEDMEKRIDAAREKAGKRKKEQKEILEEKSKETKTEEIPEDASFTRVNLDITI